MIIQERVKYRDVDCVRLFSNANRYIVNGENKWGEVCVPLEEAHLYSEGEEMPCVDPTAEEILGIIFGGEV